MVVVKGIRGPRKLRRAVDKRPLFGMLIPSPSRYERSLLHTAMNAAEHQNVDLSERRLTRMTRAIPQQMRLSSSILKEK